MKTINRHKLYSLEEAKDEIFGKTSEERVAYEQYAIEERQKENIRQHRVLIPESLYNLLRQKAETNGISVSRYVRNTLSAVLA